MATYQTLHSEAENPKKYFKSIISARKDAYSFNVSTDFGPDYNYVYEIQNGKKKIIGTVVANCIHTNKGYRYFAVYVPEGHIKNAAYLKSDGTLGKKVTPAEVRQMEYPLNWKIAYKYEF